MKTKRLNMIVGRGSSGVSSPYASAAGLLWSNTLSRADRRRRPCRKATSVDLPFQVSIIQRHPAAVSAAASAITWDGEAKRNNLQALQQKLIARHDSDDKPMRLLAGTDELEAGTVEWSVPELRDSASVDSGLEHGRNEALEFWPCRGAVDNFLPPASCQWLINASEAAARAIPPISDAEFSLYLLGDAAEAVLGPAANEAYNILLRRIKVTRAVESSHTYRNLAWRHYTSSMAFPNIYGATMTHIVVMWETSQDELEKQTCHGSELRLEIAGAILYRLKVRNGILRVATGPYMQIQEQMHATSMLASSCEWLVL